MTLLYKRATLLSDLGKKDEAQRDFSRVLELKPGDFDTLMRRAGIFIDQGAFQKALDDLIQASSIKPQDRSVILERAAIYKKLKKYDKAADDFATAINLDPSSKDTASLYYSLGESLLLARKQDYAIRAFTKALQMDPKNGLAYANRGVAFKDKGDWRAAESDFRSSLNLLEKASSRKYVSRLLTEVETRIQRDEPKGLVDQVLGIFPKAESEKTRIRNLW